MEEEGDSQWGMEGPMGDILYPMVCGWVKEGWGGATRGTVSPSSSFFPNLRERGACGDKGRCIPHPRVFDKLAIFSLAIFYLIAL